MHLYSLCRTWLNLRNKLSADRAAESNQYIQCVCQEQRVGEGVEKWCSWGLFSTAEAAFPATSPIPTYPKAKCSNMMIFKNPFLLSDGFSCPPSPAKAPNRMTLEPHQRKTAHWHHAATMLVFMLVSRDTLDICTSAMRPSLRQLANFVWVKSSWLLPFWGFSLVLVFVCISKGGRQIENPVSWFLKYPSSSTLYKEARSRLFPSPLRLSKSNKRMLARARSPNPNPKSQTDQRTNPQPTPSPTLRPMPK